MLSQSLPQSSKHNAQPWFIFTPNTAITTSKWGFEFFLLLLFLLHLLPFFLLVSITQLLLGAFNAPTSMAGAFLRPHRSRCPNSRTCCILRETPIEKPHPCKSGREREKERGRERERKLILAHLQKQPAITLLLAQQTLQTSSPPLYSLLQTPFIHPCAHRQYTFTSGLVFVPIFQGMEGAWVLRMLKEPPSLRNRPPQHRCCCPVIISNNDRVSLHKVELWQTFTVWQNHQFVPGLTHLHHRSESRRRRLPFSQSNKAITVCWGGWGLGKYLLWMSAKLFQH